MAGRKDFTTYNPQAEKNEMTPAQLRAIRMDMGLGMVAMANLVQAHTTSRLSRDKYRALEKPRPEGEWPFIPRHIGAAVEKLYRDFYDFVDTLVATWDGSAPLVLIHRNDMFAQAGLPLPEGITVENYNQAVGKAWGRILEQGHLAELAYFSTDVDDLTGPGGPYVERGRVQDPAPENVGALPELPELKSFVRMSWDNGDSSPYGEDY